MNDTFIVETDDGAVEMTVLFTFELNNNHYIAYTDGSVDPTDGMTKVFASRFNPCECDPVLYPLSGEEFDMVEVVLESLFDDD